MKLRPYQADAMRALANSPWQRPLIAHATGLGKTIVFAHWLRDGPRALVLAHRDELVRQAVDKLRMITPDARVGVVKADDDEVDAPIVVGSVQTLARARRFRRLMRAGAFGRVVCDEAHHVSAESYQRLMTDLGAFEAGGPRVLGVTATPARGDQKPLGATWQGIVHHMSILDGIQQGYLAPLKALEVRLDCDFKKLRTVRGEIRDDDAEAMLLRARAPYHIAQAVAEYASDRPTLVFTPTVRTAHEVRDACLARGIAAASVEGTTPLEERRATLRAFHDGRVQLVANCAVLTEGYDESVIGCIVMARPTKSEPFYVQCVGRGTRLWPGKADCLVIDVVGVTRRHDLVTAAKLLTHHDEHETISSPRGEGIAASSADEPVAIPDAALHAEPVDLFAARPFAWIKSPVGYVLDLGAREDGFMLLEQAGRGWRVCQLREHARPGSDWQDVHLTELWRGPDLGYAQGMAEEHVRACGVEALAKAGARWRRDPMTPGQQRMCDAWRIAWAATWTKGEAAEAISKTIATALRKRAHEEGD